MYPKKPILEQLLYFGALGGLSKKQAAANADRLLKRLQMHEYRLKRLDTLSKGNQQKIQLVATLIADPDIVILDEPFSGLDPVNAMLLKDLVKELIHDGKIVLFSSHQMNYIEEFCDEIAILNRGKIAVSGGIREIKRSFGKSDILLRGENNGEIYSFIRESCADTVQRTELSEEGVLAVLRAPELKADLLRAVSQCRTDIDEFRVKEPSLNEIFVRYTEDAI